MGKGALANVSSPRAGAPGVSGAMDLVIDEVIVVIDMERLTRDGESRIAKECTYPLTADRTLKLLFRLSEIGIGYTDTYSCFDYSSCNGAAFGVSTASSSIFSTGREIIFTTTSSGSLRTVIS